jgi:hypothetical protein
MVNFAKKEKEEGGEKGLKHRITEYSERMHPLELKLKVGQ